MEVGLDRVARQRLEGRLGAEHARRPVGLRIERARAGRTAAGAGRAAARAQPLLVEVQAVAAVAAEALVAAVAGQRDGHVLARELADAVGRNRRAVGIRLVVEPRQRVDQVEVVALDPVDEVPRAVAIGDLLREARLVERRVGERDRAGVDRRRPTARHRRDDGARVDAAGQERAERHLGDHPQPHRFVAAARRARLAASRPSIGVSSVKRTSQYSRGSGTGCAAPDRQRVRRRQLARAAEDRARLGDVAEREVLLDRARVDVAREAAVREQRLQLGAEEQACRPAAARSSSGFTPRRSRARNSVSPVAVPQREREHAAEALDAVARPTPPRRGR